MVVLEKRYSEVTIAALATAPAPAGIAVVRVSGPRAKDALRSVFRAAKDPVQNPRLLVFGDVVDFHTNSVIDRALVVFMPGPHSYTGEDTVEFQFHGSQLLVQKVLRSLFASGVVAAEPGEFTKRAFLNGKIDLLQAEAIADLINAASDEALIIAGQQLKGRMSKLVDGIAEPLRNLLAETEAALDFSDDGVSSKAVEKTCFALSQAHQQVSALLKTYDFGHRVRDGMRVLLFGMPNVGKSSLLNLFVGNRRALVSAQPGTTRDVIEESVTYQGYKLVLCDVAGIRATNDDVESQGVALARERIAWAHIILLVVDAVEPGDWRELLSELLKQSAKVWLVVNKIDAAPGAFAEFDLASNAASNFKLSQVFFISALNSSGFEPLRDALIAEIAVLRGGRSDGGEDSSAVTNERQRMCLVRAEEQLSDGIIAAGGESANQENSVLGEEIIAHHIRLTLAALEELVGKTYTDDLLGRIFSQFCIGK